MEGSAYFGNGNVGIGSTSPGSALDVNGNIRASSVVNAGLSGTYSIAANNGFYYSQAPTRAKIIAGTLAGGGAYPWRILSGDSGNTGGYITLEIDGAEKFRVSNSGYVGIGSTVPQATLDLEGSAYFGNGNIGVGSSVPSQKIDVLGTVKATAFIGDGSGLTGLPANGGWTRTGTNVYVTTGTDNVGIGTSVPQAKLDVEGSVYVGNGNVGIGTSTPKNPLDVKGSAVIGASYAGVNSPTANGLLVEGNTIMGATAIPDGYVGSNIKLTVYQPSATDYAFLASSSDQTAIFLSNLSTDMATGRAFQVGVTNETFSRTVFYSDGKIGIGPGNATRDVVLSRSSANTFKISSDGANGAGHLVVLGNLGIGSTAPLAKLDVEGSAYFGNGNVGIGTTAPSRPFEILANNSGTAIKLRNTSINGAGAISFVSEGGGNESGRIGLFNSNYANAPFANNLVIGTNGADLVIGDIAFWTAQLVIKNATGNVGISSAAPQAKLDVEGSAYFGNGNIGVGSSAPSQKIDVLGTVKATAFIGDGSGLTGISAGGGWSRVAPNLYPTNITDNVGIGSTVPQAKLDVEGSVYVGNGNVGIGTSSLGASLDINNTVGYGSLKQFQIIGHAGDLAGGPATWNGYATTMGNYFDYPDRLVYGIKTNVSEVVQTGALGAYGIYSTADTSKGTSVAGYFSATSSGGGFAYSLITGTGNVGIGSTAPQARLDVEGSAYFGNGNIGVGSSVPSQKIDVLGTVKATAFIGDGSGLTGISAAGGWSRVAPNLYPTTITDNVGIGSSVPQAKLDVEGNVYVGNGNIGVGTNAPNDKLEVSGNIAMSYGATRKVYIPTASDDSGGQSLQIQGGAGGRRIDASGGSGGNVVIDGGDKGINSQGKAPGNVLLASLRGNVGIGTTLPGAMLDVEGSAYFGSGNVGVGSSAPTAALSITAPAETTLLSVVGVQAYSSSNPGSGIILSAAPGGLIGGGAGGPITLTAGAGGSGSLHDGVGGNINLTAGAGGAGDGTDRGKGGNIVINPGAAGTDVAGNIALANLQGNVGIGTSVPKVKLDVEGSVYVGNGNIGVGSSAPSQKIDVLGTVKATAFIGDGSQLTNLSSGGGGGWSRTGTNIYQTTITDNVGIGSTVPQAKLDVEGGVYVGNGNVGIGGVPSARLSVQSTLTNTTGTVYGGTITLNAIPSSGGTANFYGLSVGANFDINAMTSITAISGGIGNINSGGTVTTAVGVEGFVSKDHGAITTAKGGYFHVSDDGGASITNSYGVHIGTVTGANSWALYSNSTAPSYFGGNVGINSSVPQAKLDVEGNVYFGSGNVGIGTTAAALLSVWGGTAPVGVAGSGITMVTAKGGSGGNAGGDFTITTGQGSGTGGSAGNVLVTGGNGKTGPDGTGRGGSITLNPGLGAGAPNGNVVLSSAVGNVGIGSSVPQAKLDVEGASYFGNGNIGVGSSDPSQAVDVLGTVKATAFIGDGSGLTGISAGGGWSRVAPNLYPTTITDNIGIGSSVPQARLDVEGNAYFGNGSVGIGTTGPNTKLTVFGTSTPMETDFTQNVANNSIAIANTFMPDSYSPGMMWYTSDSNSTKPFAGIWTDHRSSGSHMYLGTSSNYSTGITNHGITIDYNGNVGIGTSVPNTKFTVLGTSSFTETDFTQNVANNSIAIANALIPGNYSPGMMWYTSDSNSTKPFAGIWTDHGISGSHMYLGTSSNYSTGITNHGIAIDYNGNVGIGTSTPGGQLVVYGGNVGIGTLVPNTKLTVFGTSSPTETDFTQNVANNSIAIANALIPGNYSPGMMWYTSDSNSTKPFAGIWTDHGASGSHMYLGTSSNYTTGITNHGIAIDYNGNVGIGSTAPQAKLSFGPLTGSAAVHFYDGGAGARYGAGAQLSELQFFVPGAVHISFNAGGDLQSSGTNELMRIQGNGNVGIGTTAPQAKLDVEGNIYVGNGGGSGGNVGIGSIAPVQKLDVVGTVKATSFIGDGSGLTGITGTTQWGNGAASAIYYTSGNVGIGTTSPQAKFDVSANGVAVSADRYLINATAAYSFNVATRSLYGVYSAPTTNTSGGDWANAQNNYAFYGQSSGGQTNWGIYLTGETKNYFSGNVGIGTTGPQAKLDVEGSVYIGNGNVGVGSSAPSQKIDVLGTVKATAFIGDGSGLTGLSSSQWITNGTNIYYNTGNVGIGTTNPVDMFAIGTAPVASNTHALVNLSNTALSGASANGTYLGANPAAFSGNLVDLQIGGNRKFGIGGTNNGLLYLGTSSGIEIGNNGTFAQQSGLNNGAATTWWSFTNQEGGWIDNGNYTQSYLSVYPTYNPAGDASTSIKALNSSPTFSPTIASTITGQWISLSADGTFGNGTNTTYNTASPMVGLQVVPVINVNTASTGGYTGILENVTETSVPATGAKLLLDLQVGGASKFKVDSTGVVTGVGNVGVGSSVPSQKVDVLGTVKATAFIGDGSGLTGLTASGWSRVAPNLYPTTITDNVGIGSTVPQAKLDVEGGIYVGNGNVGIGTSAPGAPLQIKKDAASGTNLLAFFGTPSMPTASTSYVQVQQYNGGAATNSAYLTVTADSTVRLNLGNSSDQGETFSDLVIRSPGIGSQHNIGIGTSVPRAKLDVEGSVYFGNGNVGIGTTAPAQTLDINGGLRLSGGGDTSFGGNVGIGSSSPLGQLNVKTASGLGQVTLDGPSGGCLMIRDTNGTSWTECHTLNGTLTCSANATGVCTGS